MSEFLFGCSFYGIYEMKYEIRGNLNNDRFPFLILSQVKVLRINFSVVRFLMLFVIKIILILHHT